MNVDIMLSCKAVIYHSDNDEAAFFEWIKKIECIDKLSGYGDELYLHILSDKLYDHDLRELVSLFYRYNIDMKQLAQFLNNDNRRWFYENKKAFWHEQIFGE